MERWRRSWTAGEAGWLMVEMMAAFVLADIGSPWLQGEIIQFVAVVGITTVLHRYRRRGFSGLRRRRRLGAPRQN